MDGEVLLWGRRQEYILLDEGAAVGFVVDAVGGHC